MQTTLNKRFDGYLPIVVDVETSGVDPLKHSLLEIAAVTIKQNEESHYVIDETFICHVIPFEGAKLDPKAMEITKIDPYHPFRFAVDEEKALHKLFKFSKKAVNAHHCRRAVLVGHNAHFDLGFIQTAMQRCEIKSGPFHSFTCLDTATLSGLVYGKTVLAKALKKAGIAFDKDKAHSALYDAEKTAELFCLILNRPQFGVFNPLNGR